MDAREDYVQKVAFQLSGVNHNGMGKSNYMTTWDEVIRELSTSSEFGNQLGKNIPGTGAFIDGVKAMPVAEEKMKAVYNYVRSNMQWDGAYSKYAGEGVKKPWEKKKGTSGEINLILVNLLKDAGLEAYPALVSQRSYGKINTDLPFVDQFRTVFACVMINEKKFFLDAATSDNTPVNIIPSNILNTTALIVHRKKGGLVTITNDSLQYSDYISTQMQLDEKGALSGEAYIKSDGYSRLEKVSEYKALGSEKYIKSNYQKDGLTIKDFEFLTRKMIHFPQNKNLNSVPALQEVEIMFTCQLIFLQVLKPILLLVMNVSAT